MEDYVTDRRKGWVWLDGSGVTWLTWKADEPSLNDGCARLNQYQKKINLMGNKCETPYYFICKQVRVMTL